MSKKPKDDEVKKLTPKQLKKLRGGGGDACGDNDAPAISACFEVHSACSGGFQSVGPSGGGKKNIR